jgi:pilus assembly protein FimV
MRFSTAKIIMLVGLGTLMLLFPADGLRALGLGEARVNSYLGQPLDISIRLIEADADALDSLTAEHASSSDYDRLGVPTEVRALGLEVRVDHRSDPPVLRVTSRRPAQDPVVRFMIDARWASGRLLREYTVFLDPPTFEVAPPVTRRDVDERPAERPTEPEPESARPERPAPDRPARPAEPTPEPEPEPTPAPTPEPEPRPEPRSDVVGPVAAGQTLWGIAYDWRPDTSLTMNQVMLAILDRNPHAFRDNNVNRLQRGAELTMPGREDIEALSPGEADRRMQAQMQAWRDRVPERRDVPVVAEEAVPEVEAPREDEPAEAGPDPEVVHRLEVVPPESDLFDDGPAVSDGEIQRASRRLSELEDQMYADGVESDELYRQIEDIREAIDTREAAGLAVADEEMAVLESRLRRARLARLDAPQRVPEPDAGDDAISDYFGELEEELADTDPAAREEDVTEPRMDPADEVVAEPEPEAVPVATEPETTGLPWWLWLVGVLILAGLVAGVVIALKRRAESDTKSATVAGRGRANAVEAARKRVAADPKNLAAHLALIKVLADRNDNEGFAEALDDMYRQVENDEHPDWQEALNLAVTHAPDHPLLTPPEERFEDDRDDDDEGLDDRTREMLGILESEDQARPGPDDYELGSDVEPDAEVGDDEFFAAEEGEQDTASGSPDTRLMMDEESDSAGEDEDMGENLDLAELSDRLDDPALATREEERYGASDDDEIDIGEFDVDDDRDRVEDMVSEAGENPDKAEDIFSEIESDEVENDDFKLDVDDDLAAPEVDQSVSDTEEPEVDDSDDSEDGDRQIEAFLADGGDAEQEPPEGDELADADDRDVPELSDEDAEVKLDLARAYLSMDDPESARALLEEIMSGGSSAMRDQAAKLLENL